MAPPTSRSAGKADLSGYTLEQLEEILRGATKPSAIRAAGKEIFRRMLALHAWGEANGMDLRVTSDGRVVDKNKPGSPGEQIGPQSQPTGPAK